MLYPELKVIVRYNKQTHFEIILKNVKKTYIDDRYKVMLSIPGTNDLEVEYFLTSLFGYCPILNENNCVIKYLGKKGSNQISKPIP